MKSPKIFAFFFRMAAVWATIGTLFSAPSLAIYINPLNGGVTISNIDFSLPSAPIPLELVRSYNSLTALNESGGWSGAFGWGWTSPFETTMTVTPERDVLLRDGFTGNTILFKLEKEDPRAREEFFANVKKAYFERKMNKKLTSGELKHLSLPKNFQADLIAKPKFRFKVANDYDIKGTIPKGELLISTEYGYQTLLFKDNQWVREKDGVIQIFDKEGRLNRQVDKSGLVFEYRYHPNQKMQVAQISVANKGLALKFTWQQDRVWEIVDNKGNMAKFKYDAGGNLIQATDSLRQVYGYKYENKKFPHLLTKIEYLSEEKDGVRPYREMRYDTNGLIAFHHDRDNSEITFIYGRSASDPENNFSTKLIRKLANGKTEEQFDEFTIKNRADGTKYLYKQDSKVNGVFTSTIFTACCGKPAQVTRGGEVTNYKYSEDGLLSEKTSGKENIKLSYDQKWKKVKRVEQNGVVSNFEYDSKGNLFQAFNSRKQRISLAYNPQGYIERMTDSSGRKITFRYTDTGRPTLISEKGVGTLEISYDKDGKITKTESVLDSNDSIRSKSNRKPTAAQSQEIVRQVMKSFQEFISIIRPAGVGVGSGV